MLYCHAIFWGQGGQGGEGVHCGKVSVKSNTRLFVVLKGYFAYLYFPIHGIDGRGDRACSAIGEMSAILSFCDRNNESQFMTGLP